MGLLRASVLSFVAVVIILAATGFHLHPYCFDGSAYSVSCWVSG